MGRRIGREIAILIVADHLRRSYTPLDGAWVEDKEALASLLHQELLEPYAERPDLYRITDEGLAALAAFAEGTSKWRE